MQNSRRKMSITSSDLKSVYTVTFEARNKWRNILLSLDFENGTIKNIGEKWHDNAEDCYREGLSEWLEGGERSWGDLMKALSNPTVGHRDIAVRINEEHICSVTPETKTADVVPSDHHCQIINESLIIFTNEKIGAGAFGVVFKGSYKTRECAVKVLHEVAMQMQTNLPACQEGKNTADFDRECEFLKSFQHPNIVQHLSTEKHPKSGSTILVTELMSCNVRTYLSSLREETLTSHCQISLSKDVASGLAYIHSRHIIHRDLCGDNILLALSQPVPVAKISDFGMSRLLDPSQMSSTLTAVAHRIGYLPPEALREHDEKYDHSLDVFSLGVIMVQIVLKVETVKSMKDRSLYVSQIPGTHQLKVIISRCLQENMRRRPSAEEICAFLDFQRDVATGPSVSECRAILPTELDHLQHKQTSPARLLSDSTDHSSPYSSESADTEQLSDPNSTNEEAPLTTSNHYFSQTGIDRSVSAEDTSKVSPSKHVMPRTMSEGEGTQVMKSKRRLWTREKGRKTSASEEKTDSDQSAMSAEGLTDTPCELQNVDSEVNAGDNVEDTDKELNWQTTSMTNKVIMRHHLEPVGVFWDIENCPVPHNKSAFSLAAKIRRTFFVGKREVEFKCVCDIKKQRREVIDALNEAQVTLVHESTMAASDKLRRSLRRFAYTYPDPPSTIVLISGDINFSPELNDLRYIHNITIVLLHSRQASDALKEFANTAIDFDSFVDDVDMHTVKQVVALSVPGAPQTSQPAQAPHNLSGISAAFRNLLMHSPNFELPYSHFKQEYDTFYHKSFRVSDYLPEEGSSTRQLIMACDGITLKEVHHNGRRETVVCFEQSQLTDDENSKRIELIGAPKDSIELCEKRIEYLLCSLPDHQITLDRFILAYEKFHGERLSHFYGHSKLIKLLENLPSSSLEFRGEGVRRKVILKPMRAFALEIEKLLSDRPQGLPINAVVPAYKEKFGRDLVVTNLGFPKLIRALEAITDVIDIKGVGPARTIHLKSPSITVPVLPTTKVTTGCVELVQSSSTTPKKLCTASQPPADTLTPKASGQTSPQNGKARFDDMPALVSVSPSKAKDKPSETKKTPPASPVKDAERLSSETKRLLLRHSEHALTLSELVESFRESRDPARPTAEMLYKSLSEYNTRTAGGQRFEFSDFINSKSVRETLIQLNRPACLTKLSSDLQYLFIYRPTTMHTMLLSELEGLYTECYGHKLNSAMYGSPTVELLFDYKQVKSLVKLDQTTRKCSLTEQSHQQVLISLLSELIFVKGNERTLSMSDLPMLYRDYFGCPLAPSSFGVKKISQLFQLSKVKQAISLDSSGSNMVLAIPYFVAEQLRHLLTIYDGRVPFSDLEHIHAQFQEDIDIKKLLKSLIYTVSNVVNFAGNHKWVVWAPGGRPYPPHRRGSDIPPPTVDIQGADSDYSPREKSEESFTEWPSFDEVPPLSQPEPPVGVLVDITSGGSDNQTTPIAPPSLSEPPPLLIRDTPQKTVAVDSLLDDFHLPPALQSEGTAQADEDKEKSSAQNDVLLPLNEAPTSNIIMEAEERKKKPKKAGPARKKPTMAIRFPGQPSSASSTAPSVSNSNQASISGDNGRDSPLSSSSALRRLNFEGVTDEPV